jgi:signal peptidase I
MSEPIQLDPQVQEPAEPEAKPSIRRKVIYTGFSGFLLLLLVFVAFFWQSFKTIEVQGDSMEPTLHAGERLLISKAYWLVGGIEDNDIVVIRNPYEKNEVIIKRVANVAGEAVDLANVWEDYDVTSGPYIVPAGTIYVLGDNRPVSQDSRHWGPFSLDDVVGKVVVFHSARD